MDGKAQGDGSALEQQINARLHVVEKPVAVAASTKEDAASDGASTCCEHRGKETSNESEESSPCSEHSRKVTCNAASSSPDVATAGDAKSSAGGKGDQLKSASSEIKLDRDEKCGFSKEMCRPSSARCQADSFGAVNVAECGAVDGSGVRISSIVDAVFNQSAADQAPLSTFADGGTTHRFESAPVSIKFSREGNDGTSWEQQNSAVATDVSDSQAVDADSLPCSSTGAETRVGAPLENSGLEMQEGPDVEEEYGMSFSKYKVCDRIGPGLFGRVFLAETKTEPRTRVAIKRIVLDEETMSDGLPAWIFREASSLKRLRNPHIVTLIEVIMGNSGAVFFVFEYIGKNLRYVLKEYEKAGEHMPPDEIRKLAWSLFEGVHACHAGNVLHRDLKPGHILVTDDGNSKICDFGLARDCCQTARQFSNNVVTLWYRAPEIILGAETYGPEIDVWSAGCILGEMALGGVLFPGDSEIDTLYKIFKVLGTPNETTWPGCKKLVHYATGFPQWRKTEFNNFTLSRPDLVDFPMLLEQLLANPTARITAEGAKRSNFFLHMPSGVVQKKS